MLVLGADDRPGAPGRSDTMMLASVDLDRQDVRILSIPRDSWVDIPGEGWDKINHAYAFGKEGLSLRTVNGLLGIPVDHYVVLNFQGFKKVVDTLGGVTIQVEKDLKYDDPYDDPPLHIDLKAGAQRLDGERALQYARFRHDNQSDEGRMMRQQKMIRALVEEVLKPKNLLRLPSLISQFLDAVRTDIPLTDMLQFVPALKKGATPDKLQTKSLFGKDLWIEGVYYLQLDLANARKTAYQFLMGGEPGPDFLEKAERDALVYSGSVNRAVSEAAARHPSSAGSTGAPGQPNPGGGSTSSNGKGKVAPTGPGGPPPSSPDTPAPDGKGRLKRPLAISLVDASRGNLAVAYFRRLSDAGFRVVKLGRSPQLESRTRIVVRGGAPGEINRLAAQFPGALVVSAPDQRAETTVDIVLGSDLLKEPSPTTR